MREYTVKLDDVTAKIFETLVEMTNNEMNLNLTPEDAMAEVITQFVQQNYMKYAGYIRKKEEKK